MENNNQTEEINTIDKAEEASKAAAEETAEAEVSEHHHHHSEHHGEEHHHHHHHHHRHHHSSRKKKFPMTRGLAITLVVVLLLAFVFEIVLFVKSQRNSNPATTDTQKQEEVSISVVVSKENVLVNPAVVKYLQTDLNSAYYRDVTPGQLAESGRIDAEYPITMDLIVSGTTSSFFCVVEYADNLKFTNSRTLTLGRNEKRVTLPHLYTNCTYYYRVLVYTASGVSSKTGSFTTADTPRILSVDGIYNVRDIGNWKTAFGKRIRQGLLIRGTELDGAVEEGYHLTNEGLMDMLENLQIKTDMDLRAETETSMDALGSRVQHNYYDMVMYGDIFTDAGKEKIRAVFADLANPDNYPVYLHCTYGRDRTGTVCYLLEALLGVSEADCLRDYGLSNSNVANILTVQEGLNSYVGTTLKDKTASYLISCGVTVEQINSLRNIFLGD